MSLQAESHLWDLLASGIPAMSFAAEANPIDVIDNTSIGGVNRNYDMEALRGDNQSWPVSRKEGFYGSRWLHNDIKNMSSQYVYKIYDAMLEIGGLKP